MARDAALLERAGRTGETVFAVYAWSSPTLSFGRNQKAAGRYDRVLLRERNVAVVRRPTGGRAILHHREITYSVTAPVSREPFRAAYERINGILISALRRLGAPASLSSGGAALTPDSLPCFARPGAGEIVAGGRKLVGSAQWRNEHAFLQHGSILVDDDQSALAQFAAAGAADASTSPPKPATLRDLLGAAPTSEEVATAMFEAVAELERCEGEDLSETEIRPEALARLPEFLSDAWTWRR